MQMVSTSNSYASSKLTKYQTGISSTVNEKLHNFHDTKYPKTPESINSPQISSLSTQNHSQPTSLSSISRSELVHELSSEHVPSIKSQDSSHILRSTISNYSAELDAINSYFVPELPGSPPIQQEGKFRASEPFGSMCMID